MMTELLLDTGLWAIIAGSAFSLMLLFSIIGAIIEPRLKNNPVRHKSAGKVMLSLMLALCIILGLSFIPFMVGTVLGFQEIIGNRDVPAVGFAIDHQVEIVLVLWSIMILGSLIAIPAMLHDMKVE
jgi:hypothetical protein